MLAFPKTENFELAVAVTVSHCGSASGRTPDNFTLPLRMLAEQHGARKRETPLSKLDNRDKQAALESESRDTQPIIHIISLSRVESFLVSRAGSNWGSASTKLPMSITMDQSLKAEKGFGLRSACL